MLSKVWGAKGTLLDNDYDYEVSGSGSSATTSYNYTDPITLTVTTWGNIDFIIDGQYKSGTNSSSWTFPVQIYINIDGTDYSYETANSTGTDWQDFSEVKSVNLAYGRHTITVKVWAIHYNGGGYWSDARLNHVKILNFGTISTKTGNRNIKPNEVKNIGELATGTSFGRLSNNDIYVWANPTTNFTTWNIAPGNFVGFLSFWDYKIPYYL